MFPSWCYTWLSSDLISGGQNFFVFRSIQFSLQRTLMLQGVRQAFRITPVVCTRIAIHLCWCQLFSHFTGDFKWLDFRRKKEKMTYFTLKAKPHPSDEGFSSVHLGCLYRVRSDRIQGLSDRDEEGPVSCANSAESHRALNSEEQRSSHSVSPAKGLCTWWPDTCLLNLRLSGKNWCLQHAPKMLRGPKFKPNIPKGMYFLLLHVYCRPSSGG